MYPFTEFPDMASSGNREQCEPSPFTYVITHTQDTRHAPAFPSLCLQIKCNIMQKKR